MNVNEGCDLNNWQIKEEGRKKLELDFNLEPNKEKIIEFGGMWTETGDTLFLRDDEFKLVLWYSY